MSTNIKEREQKYISKDKRQEKEFDFLIFLGDDEVNKSDRDKDSSDYSECVILSGTCQAPPSFTRFWKHVCEDEHQIDKKVLDNFLWGWDKPV